jgi:hypothetical protein
MLFLRIIFAVAAVWERRLELRIMKKNFACCHSEQDK